MNALKKEINEQCLYKLPEPLLDQLLALATEVKIKPRHTLINYGQFDDNIYILKEGTIRYQWFDGLNERVYGFALPGTIMISYHCYYMRQPSFFQLSACRQGVTVLRLSKKEIDNLIDTSFEFAKWMLSLSLAQLHINEFKLSVINGSARERFEGLIRNRPEIMRDVSMRMIASYLGVTPAYLSRMKNDILNKNAKR